MSERALEKLRAYNAATEGSNPELEVDVVLDAKHQYVRLTRDDLRRVEAEVRAETLREFGCDLRDLAAEGHANKALGAVGSLLNRRIAETIKPEAAS